MENAESNSIVFDFCEIPLLLALFVGIFFYVFQQKSITVLLEAIVLNILNWWATVNTIAANERSFLHIIRLIQAIFQRRFVSIFIVCWNFSVHDWRLVQFFSVFYLVFESVQKIRPDLVWEVDDNVRKKKKIFFCQKNEIEPLWWCHHSLSSWNRFKNHSRCHNVLCSLCGLKLFTFFQVIAEVIAFSVSKICIIWVHGNQRTVVFARCTVSITADFARMNNECLEISTVLWGWNIHPRHPRKRNRILHSLSGERTHRLVQCSVH